MFADKNEPKSKKVNFEREKLIKKHKITFKSRRDSYVVSNGEKNGTNYITDFNRFPYC